MEASNGASPNVTLVSPVMRTLTKQCFNFAYHMRGAQVGTLQVTIYKLIY